MARTHAAQTERTHATKTHNLGSYETLTSAIAKARGLMFRKRIDKPLLFILNSESRIAGSIHSFFVFMRFDAIYLDSKGTIVDLIPNIHPFTPLIVPKKPAKYLIEARSGTITAHKLRLNDKVKPPIKK
ncbi:MAG: DUF192 domain-containing protein [DPANN group archaeon]|nr:DUF192 domain-containing protein [DPANN group archaeon]